MGEYAAVVSGCLNNEIAPEQAAKVMQKAAAWSEFMVARVIINTRTLYTLPLGLESLSSTFQTEWANYAAGSVLVSLPVVLLFLFLNRYFVSGLTLGGVKQ